MMEITNKIKKTVNNSSFDVLLALGVANIKYISGISIPLVKTHKERPLAVIWPKKIDPILVAPYEWEDTISQTSRIKKIESYNEAPDSFIKTISK